MNETHLRLPRRVRHELKFRRARVEMIEQLTPVLKRIVLTGDELEGFFSPGFDDHVKVFPTAHGQAPVLPTVGPDGPVFAEAKPVARDYTPRAFDAANRRLTLDFAVGHGGPATAWAEGAQGQVVIGTDHGRVRFQHGPSGVERIHRPSLEVRDCEERGLAVSIYRYIYASVRYI